MWQARRSRTVRWRPLEGEGLEHLTLEPAADRILIRSVVIGERGGAPYGVSYRIDCDPRWRVLAFAVETTDGRRLASRSPAEGRWHTEAGSPLPEFDGCVDIDLSGTPFTNTLPVRRLDLTRAHGTVELDMLYVPFDSFQPCRDGQRYACLAEGRLYRYEAADRSFTADLPLDEDGLVTDYPTLFRRV